MPSITRSGRAVTPCPIHPAGGLHAPVRLLTADLLYKRGSLRQAQRALPGHSMHTHLGAEIQHRYPLHGAALPLLASLTTARLPTRGQQDTCPSVPHTSRGKPNSIWRTA